MTDGLATHTALLKARDRHPTVHFVEIQNVHGVCSLPSLGGSDHEAGAVEHAERLTAPRAPDKREVGEVRDRVRHKLRDELRAVDRIAPPLA